MTMLKRLILAAALLAAPAMAQVPPPVPALPDTARIQPYTLTASNCSCAVNFAIYGDGTDYQDWLEVWINGQLAPYNDSVFGWTITSPSQPSLATAPRPITDAVLTFNQPVTGTVQIVGARRPRRVSQFNENAGVPARNLNQALTDIIAMLREDWDKINDVSGRAVLAPPGETINVLTAMANRANQGACFDSGGNLIPCVSVPTSTFSAGNGIAFTGTNPTVIKNNIQAGNGILIGGTNPLTITENFSGTSPVVVTPGQPTTVSCPTCATGAGTANSSIIGNVPQLSNTTDTGITDSGVPAAGLPQATGLVPAAVPTSANVTITGPATPAVITETGHTHKPNDPITLTNSGGALPAGFTSGNTYFVVGSSITANTYTLATTVANAKAGIAVNSTGAGTGTQTAAAWASIPPGYKGHIDSVTVLSSPGVNINFQTVTGIASMTMNPGIYDCSGEDEGTTTGGALVSEFHTVITTIAPPTLTSLPNIGNGNGNHVLYIANNTGVFNFGPGRYVFTVPTTIWLAMYATYGTNAGVGNNGSGGLVGWGYLRCETK